MTFDGVLDGARAMGDAACSPPAAPRSGLAAGETGSTEPGSSFDQPLWTPQDWQERHLLPVLFTRDRKRGRADLRHAARTRA